MVVTPELNLNARLLWIRDPPLAVNYAVGFFCGAKLGKVNTERRRASDRKRWRDVRKENGFTRRRRRRAWRELGTTGYWPVDTTTFLRVPPCVLSRPRFSSRRRRRRVGVHDVGSVVAAKRTDLKNKATRRRHDASLTVP